MEEPIVKTRSGAVRGSYEKGVATFKGIPFELARQVHRTWITFATTGNPGWDPYNIQQRPVMLINTTWETISDSRPAERQAWDGIRWEPHPHNVILSAAKDLFQRAEC